MGRKFYDKGDRHGQQKRSDAPVGERLTWAKARWRQEPTTSVGGKGGMQEQLREVFGVTCLTEQLHQAKTEVVAQLAAEARERAAVAMGAEKARAQQARTPVLTPDALRRLREQETASKVPAPDSPAAPPAPVGSAPPAEDRTVFRFDELPAEKLVLPPPAGLITYESKPLPEFHAARVLQMPANLAKPGSGDTFADARVRSDYAKAFLQANPGARTEEVVEAVRVEYGQGLNPTAVRQARIDLGIPVRRGSRYGTPTQAGQKRAQEEATAAAAPPAPPPPVEKPDPAEQVVRAMAELLLGEVPQLRSLQLEVGEDGKLRKLTFGVSEVRVATKEVKL